MLNRSDNLPLHCTVNLKVKITLATVGFAFTKLLSLPLIWPSTWSRFTCDMLHSSWADFVPELILKASFKKLLKVYFKSFIHSPVTLKSKSTVCSQLVSRGESFQVISFSSTEQRCASPRYSYFAIIFLCELWGPTWAVGSYTGYRIFWLPRDKSQGDNRH